MARRLDWLHKELQRGDGTAVSCHGGKVRPMSNSVTFKRGTTYSATVTYTPAAGGPANLLTTTVTTDIIDAGGTVYPCTVTVAVNGLSFVATLPASTTAGFALGNARSDIKFVYGGVTFYSETFRLAIIDQVTD